MHGLDATLVSQHSVNIFCLFVKRLQIRNFLNEIISVEFVFGFATREGTSAAWDKWPDAHVAL